MLRRYLALPDEGPPGANRPVGPHPSLAEHEEMSVVSTVRRSRGIPRLLAAAVLIAALPPLAAPAAAQEVRLMHPEGDRFRVSGMPIREFASSLRMEQVGGPDGVLPDVCFVALVDSEGNVWEEYASEPFRSRDGELDGACIPRLPLTPTGSFPEVSVQAPLEGGFGSEVFFAGTVDWQLLVDELRRSSPEGVASWPSKWYSPGAGAEVLQPPPHLEGAEYEWVGLFFLAGPSEALADRMGTGFTSRPLLILVGGS